MHLVNIHMAIRIEYNYYFIHISPEVIERLKDTLLGGKSLRTW